MLTIAILPVKRFAQAKQRLRQELTPAAARSLAEAMFSDVLLALRRASSVDEVLVVTRDRGAQQIAGGRGAMVLDDHEHGHNAAAQQGVQQALESGAERALLVPGDCPLLDPRQLDELLLRQGNPSSALIVPDRHGTGTNALLLHPPDSLRPAFGTDSCRRHAFAAQSAGIAHEVLDVPSLALDIDTPEDLEALRATLASTRGGAAHTRGMLSQMMRSRV